MDPTGLVNHSIPRYWAPVYLFAALPPLLFLGRCKLRVVLFAGSALACVLAGLSVQEIYTRQPTSLRYVESFVRKKTRWLDVAARAIPADAIVYSEKEDKLVWSRWQVGVIRSPDVTVMSMKRALGAGRPVFILQQRFPRTGRRLGRALKKANLNVVRVDGRAGLYRVQVPQPEA